MISIFLVIQIIISVFLVGVILLQKDASDGLSGLSGSGIMGGVMAPKSVENTLTKITKYLAIAFIVNSLILGNIASRAGKSSSLIEKIEHYKSDSKTVPVGD
jgi:preprotein translocase subunit SecG